MFYINFVDRHDKGAKRKKLLDEINHIGAGMDDAQCLIGDFNVVMFPGDRMGGNEVVDSKTRFCQLLTLL